MAGMAFLTDGRIQKNLQIRGHRKDYLDTGRMFGTQLSYLRWGPHLTDASSKQRYYDSGAIISDLAPGAAPVRRKEGNVIVQCDATSTGVFPYLQANGTIRREARRPTEVFKPASMKSLAGVPFVVGHNYDGINPATIDRVTAGTAGAEVEALQSKETKAGVLRTTVNIFRQDSIARMDSGEVEVSTGYTAKFVAEPGSLNGEQYDGYQDEIEYFEIAQVKDGRLNYGLERPAVRLLTDSADAAVQMKPRQQEKSPMADKTGMSIDLEWPGQPGRRFRRDSIDPEEGQLLIELVKAAQGVEPDGDDAAIVAGPKGDADVPAEGGAVTIEMFKKLEAELAMCKETIAKMSPKADADKPPAEEPKMDADGKPFPPKEDAEKKADAISQEARALANLIALGNGHTPGYKGLPDETRKRLDSMTGDQIRRAVLADIRVDMATKAATEKASRLDSMTAAEVKTLLDGELTRPQQAQRQMHQTRTDGGGQPNTNPADRYTAHQAKLAAK